jgi:hypothetical protein
MFVQEHCLVPGLPTCNETNHESRRQGTTCLERTRFLRTCEQKGGTRMLFSGLIRLLQHVGEYA